MTTVKYSTVKLISLPNPSSTCLPSLAWWGDHPLVSFSGWASLVEPHSSLAETVFSSLTLGLLILSVTYAQLHLLSMMVIGLFWVQCFKLGRMLSSSKAILPLLLLTKKIKIPLSICCQCHHRHYNCYTSHPPPFFLSY